jgi:hypothetical protein
MPQVKNAEAQLAAFLAKYSPEIADLAEDIRGEMRKLYPTALELVYDNYNALVIGYGPTEKPSEAIFSIVLYPKWVSLFFLQAKGLPDPDRILCGSGTVARHIVLPSASALYLPEVRADATSRDASQTTFRSQGYAPAHYPVDLSDAEASPSGRRSGERRCAPGGEE